MKNNRINLFSPFVPNLFSSLLDVEAGQLTRTLFVQRRKQAKKKTRTFLKKFVKSFGKALQKLGLVEKDSDNNFLLKSSEGFFLTTGRLEKAD